MRISIYILVCKKISYLLITKIYSIGPLQKPHVLLLKIASIYHIYIDRTQVTYVCLCPNKRGPKLRQYVQKNNKTKIINLAINMYAHHIMFTQ